MRKVASAGARRKASTSSRSSVSASRLRGLSAEGGQENQVNGLVQSPPRRAAEGGDHARHRTASTLVRSGLLADPYVKTPLQPLWRFAMSPPGTLRDAPYGSRTVAEKRLALTYTNAFTGRGTVSRFMRGPAGRIAELSTGYVARVGHALPEGFVKRLALLAAAILPAALLLAAPAATAAQQEPYDLVLRHGRIVDGTGSPWYRADLAIRGGRIVRIAPAIEGPARRVIDVGGRIVAPGFIDIHTHARRAIHDVPTADNYIRQGVTTVIEGPDGSSPLPIGRFLADLDTLPLAVNVGTFVGQGSIRAEVVGEDDRPATPDELGRMLGMVGQAMREGAFGLSSGLFYVPGTFTPTDEVVALAEVAGRMGGIYISHMREEASQVVASVRETIEIGERGRMPTQITHHKVIGAANYGRSMETLRLVDEARARGVDVTIDQYPYTASATNIQAALFPSWAEEGGRDRVLARLADPATRARVHADVARIIREERGGGDPTKVVLTRCEWDPSLNGKNLAEVAQLRGMDPTVENAAEAAMWIVEEGNCGGVFHAISEEDLERILRHPATMIASDGEITRFGEAVPHPRSYGTFARVLARYVRERGVIGLEDAIRKMSAYPAQRLGLHERGVLRPGLIADVAVFDPERVADPATF
ncbi:MAG TPA: D-aminoacylase, partial [Longimicrobiaceae bacterium]|nr:D-aminoacylase [Longimicrobiaceae bacterium]